MGRELEAAWLSGNCPGTVFGWVFPTAQGQLTCITAPWQVILHLIVNTFCHIFPALDFLLRQNVP